MDPEVEIKVDLLKTLKNKVGSKSPYIYFNNEEVLRSVEKKYS